MRHLEEKRRTRQTHVMRKIVFLAVCVHLVLGVIDYVILIRAVTKKFLDTIVCRDLQMLKNEQTIFFCCGVPSFRLI